MINSSSTAFAALLLAGFVHAQTPSVQQQGTGCGGVGGIATLNSTLPWLGTTMQVSAHNLRPNTLGSLLIGWDDNWGSFQLPTSLTPIGMPGCTLHAKPDFMSSFSTNLGSVSWSVPVPQTTALNGVTAWSQVFFQDPALNQTGMGTTNGLELLLGDGSGATQMQTSVTQWGITWQFDHAYPVGKFCNGDWWVIGPVTIVGITPQCQTVNGRVMNGSMINPPVNGRQGYDSAMYGIYAGGDCSYFANMNVAANLAPGSPLVVPQGSSLISCISDPASTNGVALNYAAVLTVLDTAPPPDAFRPPYMGTDKTIRYRESQLDYTALAQLPPVAGVGTLSNAADSVARVWLDHCPGWVSQFMHPRQNLPPYYRDFTAVTGSAGLMLNCNYTNVQKRDLLVRFTQVGIDHYGNITNGMKWNVNGHCNGRKFPILFAGRVLNDSAMLGAGVTYQAAYYGPGHPNNVPTTFSEDGQTFYVEQTSPGTYNWGYGGYTASDVGLPEWGNFHMENLSSDTASWTGNSYRLCCSANGWVGPCLTMRIMGIQSAWNQQAWFDYMDRYMQIEVDGSWTESWVTWHGTMWNTYRSQF